MLTDEKREVEINRRKKGGNLSSPSSREGETARQFFTAENRMYIVSEYGIYQAFTSDDIDPDVTKENVPWVINRYLSYGSREKLFAFLLGMERNISGVILANQSKQIELRGKIIPCLVTANEIAYSRKIFNDERASYLLKVKDLKTSDLKDGSGLQIPNIEIFEISFSLFFVSLKRYLNDLFSICEWACGFDVGKGAKLDRLINRIKANKTLLKKAGNLELLERHVESVRQLNEIRNAFEHPTASTYIELKNVTFEAPASLSEPAFRLIKNENINSSLWYQYAGNLNRTYDLMCSITRDIFIVVGRLVSEGLVDWEVVQIPSEEIDDNMPIDCKIHAFLPFFRPPA